MVTIGRRFLYSVKSTSPRRRSTAVVQRFCKPKVGSSILSAGTILNQRLTFQAALAPICAGAPQEHETLLLAGACADLVAAGGVVAITVPPLATQMSPLRILIFQFVLYLV